MENDVLVPIDGSGPSERALEFAATFARRFDATLHVVHITDAETEATDAILDRAREILAAEGIEGDPMISIDLGLGFRSANRIGENILRLAAEHDCDHVIMGHHGTDVVGRAILGSAAETVLRAHEVRVTVVP